jgi:hypothetical protein
VVPAVVHGVLSLHIPESPQDLIRRGRTDAALSVIANVTGAAEPEQRFKEIEESIENERRSTYRDLEDKTKLIHRWGSVCGRVARSLC